MNFQHLNAVFSHMTIQISF